MGILGIGVKKKSVKSSQSETLAPNTPVIINNGHTKNRIKIRVWAIDPNAPLDKQTRPKLVAEKTVKYGVMQVKIRITKTQSNLYQINYLNLKEGKREYLYDTDLLNSIDGLSFYPYSNDRVHPDEASAMLETGAIKAFIDKGGYPIWYLIIGFIAVIACMGVLIYIFPQWQMYKDSYTADEQTIATYKQTILTLQQKVTGGGLGK